MKRTPEEALKKSALQYLHAKGIFCWAQKNQGTYDPIKKIFRKNTTLKGVSDILGIVPHDGRMIAIELKSAVGKVTPEQKIFLSTIHEHGGIAGVARSIEDIERILNKIGSGVPIEGDE